MAAETKAGSGVAWLALFVAAAGVGLAFHASRRPAPDREAESEADLLDPKSLENRINNLEGRLETAQNQIVALQERLTKAEKSSEEALSAARGAARVAAELAGPVGTGKGGTPPEGKPPGEDEKKAEGEKILGLIRSGEIPEGGVFTLFRRAQELGVLDEALAEMEKYAAAHAGDPDVQVRLGGAYIVKLMAVPDGMQRGAWSAKSLAACEAALKIDPEHWDAQYMKGMNLSQWPAFMGRQPEAIRTFEKLIEQQERGMADPKFTQTYYQLGNTYRAAGNLDKARKVFARGLELFPEDRQLKEQIDLLDKK